MAFFKKEKQVVEAILKYLEIVEECITTGLRTLEFYLADDLKEAKLAARKTRELESDADIIRYDIRNKLYFGAYLPLLREDIYKLVENIDKVANAAEACCDFFLNQRPEFPDDLKTRFLDISKESLGIVKSLKYAVLCFFKGDCTLEVVREHSKEVGMEESIVDKKEWDLTKSIFIFPDLDFAHKLHLKQCLDFIVEVSDRAEDAADQLELATLKSMV